MTVIAAEKWREAYEIGSRVDETQVMSQRLSAKQAEALHQVLPVEFQEMEPRFHHSAATPAHATQTKKRNLVRSCFYRLNEACVSCHAKCAGHRFPGLSRGSDQGAEY